MAIGQSERECFEGGAPLGMFEAPVDDVPSLGDTAGDQLEGAPRPRTPEGGLGGDLPTLERRAGVEQRKTTLHRLVDKSHTGRASRAAIAQHVLTGEGQGRPVVKDNDRVGRRGSFPAAVTKMIIRLLACVLSTDADQSASRFSPGSRFTTAGTDHTLRRG